MRQAAPTDVTMALVEFPTVMLRVEHWTIRPASGSARPSRLSAAGSVPEASADCLPATATRAGNVEAPSKMTSSTVRPDSRDVSLAVDARPPAIAPPAHPMAGPVIEAEPTAQAAAR